MAAAAHEHITFEDMEAFLRAAKYPLVSHTDMHPEMREEVQQLSGRKDALGLFAGFRCVCQFHSQLSN
jgi:hemerythrin